jgi:chorismate-pyruvate lyase
MSDDASVKRERVAVLRRKARRDPEQLIRLLRDSDSATRTLAAWTGCPVHLDLVSRRDDRLAATEFADLDVWQHDPVQRRDIRLLDVHDRALSEASATVVLGRVPYRTVRALRDSDVPLGLLLSPLHARRHTLSVVRWEGPGDEEGGWLFEIAARLDVGGRPVAFVRERYLAAVLS